MMHTEEGRIKNYLRKYYGIHHKTRIRINDKNFTIRLGDCEADIAFPKELDREIKLSILLNDTILK